MLPTPPPPSPAVSHPKAVQDTTTKPANPVDKTRRVRDNERLRDNQRASRARRKEVNAERQNKLKEYERAGVQATIEMQQAARRVAWENARLRALLTKKGVADLEVEAWLSHGEHGAAKEQPSRGHSADAVTGKTHLGVTALTNGCRPLPSAYRPGPLSVSSARSEFAATSPASPPDPAYQDGIPPSSAAPVLSTTIALSSLPDLDSCCTSGTETSCDVAAAILAGMQGHGDASRARADLGCIDSSACVVKNTKVFSLLDEAANSPL